MTKELLPEVKDWLGDRYIPYFFDTVQILPSAVSSTIAWIDFTYKSDARWFALEWM